MNDFRCLDGEANFNWRFVFHFDFLEAEEMIVVKKDSGIFTSGDSEDHRPPRFTMQLWDNDLILSDDYLSKFCVLCSAYETGLLLVVKLKRNVVMMRAGVKIMHQIMQAGYR